MISGYSVLGGLLFVVWIATGIMYLFSAEQGAWFIAHKVLPQNFCQQLFLVQHSAYIPWFNGAAFVGWIVAFSIGRNEENGWKVRPWASPWAPRTPRLPTSQYPELPDPRRQ